MTALTHHWAYTACGDAVFALSLVAVVVVIVNLELTRVGIIDEYDSHWIPVGQVEAVYFARVV